MEHQYIDKVGKSHLMMACERGDLAEVQRLLPSAHLTATTRSTGQTALHVACIQGSVPILRALLEVVPDVNVRDKAGATVLQYAIVNRRESAIAALLDTAGVDVDAADASGNSVLHYACNCNNVALVKALLARPSLDATRYNKSGLSALHVAAQRGFESCLQVLFAAGVVDVNFPTARADGRTCLMLVQNAVETARLLVAYPTLDVNAASKDGATALAHACRGNHEDVIAYLLTIPRVNVHAGRVSLFGEACKNANALRAAQLLAAPGFDEASVTPECGPIALSAACALQRVELVGRLLASPRTNYNYKDKNGLTVLLQVCLNPATDRAILEALLAMPDVDTKAVDMARETALILACEVRSYAIVELLLQVPDIDVNHKCKDWRTAYKVARAGKAGDILELLQSHPKFIPPADDDNEKMCCGVVAIGCLGCVGGVLDVVTSVFFWLWCCK